MHLGLCWTLMDLRMKWRMMMVEAVEKVKP